MRQQQVQNVALRAMVDTTTAVLHLSDAETSEAPCVRDAGR